MRLSRRDRPVAACLVLLAALVLPAIGCQRRTQLVPAGADSTAAASDSFEIRAREVQQRWDDLQAGSDAAQLSAELLRQDLAAHPEEPWPPRARALLDSLDLGAEVAADSRVLVVNFFSRAHPEGGSWPWLFWSGSKGAQAHPLSGLGLQLLQVASRPRGSSGDVRGVAVLFGRRAANGQVPILMVWNDLSRAGPEPSQTLGPDSLGGAGTANFTTLDDSIAVETRTFRGVPRFEECATCPHVFSVRRFVWDGPQFHKKEERAIPSPYSSFVQFVSALVAQDLDGEFHHVSDPTVVDAAKRYGLDVISRGSWRVAPATDETATQMVFFRGQNEAYVVSFEPRHDDWIITSITPTARTVE